MGEKVLLIAPPHMGIYKDIETELKKQGHEVDSMVLENPSNDPFFKANNENKSCNKEKFLKSLETFWDDVYSKGELRKPYDNLLVIDGTTIHPKLFSYLKEANPQIRCVAFLYDSVSLYGFDRNFDYYDKVYSFNRNDVSEYKLKFLPIYWIPVLKKERIDCYAFGMGVYSHARYEIYKMVEDICKKNKLPYFIKLYIPKQRDTFLFRIKSFVKTLLGNLGVLSNNVYSLDLVTHQPLQPETFREYIANSNVVIDTSNPHQDGLTARFMWALGEGKKIITNNKFVKEYDFYNEEQFYIVNIDDSSRLESFILEPFVPSLEYYEMVNQWRIDNWVKTVLE